MNWKSFLLGLSTGVLTSVAITKCLNDKMYVSPEKALANAKKLFQQSGPIHGSWIYMQVEPYQKGEFTYKVYKGGISRTVNEQLEQYEFVADALTGTILETVKI